MKRRRPLLAGSLAVAAAALVATIVVTVLLLLGGGTSDEEAITSLARRSIEVLPEGKWPSLYDSFTSEFQQRCPRQEFDQAGAKAASELGNDLPFLSFKRLESVTIEDRTARAVIVGEVVGQSEYKIQATFQRENGDWKIAPGPDTQRCQAFARLGG